MSQYNAPGGGVIDAGDKRIERKVVVSTGALIQAPGGRGRLTNVAVTEEPGGIRRGIFEYTEGGAGDANYNQYGKKIELMGGSREVPIYNHPAFGDLTDAQILAVQTAIEEKTGGDDFDGPASNLYQCLIRQIEYYIAPSLVARVSEIESALPSTGDLCTLASPAGVETPPNTRWIITGISATPIGDKYEVTREYTCLQDPEAAEFLYT